MTKKEALEIVKEMLEYQKQFKQKCNNCIPDEQIEALEIITNIVSSNMWLDDNYKLTGHASFDIVSETAYRDSFCKQAIQKDIEIVKNELDVLEIITDTIVYNKKEDVLLGMIIDTYAECKEPLDKVEKYLERWKGK